MLYVFQMTFKFIVRSVDKYLSVQVPWLWTCRRTLQCHMLLAPKEILISEIQNNRMVCNAKTPNRTIHIWGLHLNPNWFTQCLKQNVLRRKKNALSVTLKLQIINIAWNLRPIPHKSSQKVILCRSV